MKVQFVIGVFLCIAIAAWLILSSPDDSAQVSTRTPDPRTQASYVGTAACVDCHAAQHASYLKTTHSRSLLPLDKAELPDPAGFHHELSQREYRATGPQGSRHVEAVGQGDEKIVLHDRQIAYAVGSGNHSQSYLAPADGYLLESPMTWYAKRDGWWMSPGYDRDHHTGFERVAETGCLHCHAGLMENVQHNDEQVRIVEPAIGCESCHGPGEQHVVLHRSRGTPTDAGDPIVNPRRLTRSRADMVCANCHLRGAATVFRAGKAPMDYVPGRKLSDVRIDFAVKQTDGEMKVVGHVEQMWQSRCYTETDSLTCITCHDPHNPEAKQQPSHYREKCLSCHTADACGIPTDHKTRLANDDNCVTCHMPVTSTDIAHFAFTHHRVAVHREQDLSPQDDHTGELVPLADIGHLSLAERKRCFGLAYLEKSGLESKPSLVQHMRQKAAVHLQEAWDAGNRDGDVAAGLAQLSWEAGDRLAVQFAQAALSAETISARMKTNARVVLAANAIEQRRWAEAAERFREITTYRRKADDWAMRSRAERLADDLKSATSSMRKAVEISPARLEFRLELLELAQEVGDKWLIETTRDAITRLEAARK